MRFFWFLRKWVFWKRKKKKSFQCFDYWDSCKNDLKLGGRDRKARKVQMWKIYYEILSWLWEMHFPATFVCKTHYFSFCLNHGGASWGLNIKFCFFTYTSVACLIGHEKHSILASPLLFSIRIQWRLTTILQTSNKSVCSNVFW